ncbi:T9SS C-terminal target domain-containing protein [Putridiphycobacter roseus]|uniref:T9SS C-terminal target domain-containing protein n=1 Tax=Putridiphycobacter roseus TaxID=2219161 RepID=A0A2W1NEV2_9FLAO|nr:T9SS C-terminal target domain-containing protein [Putridiphycobacter roseus]PZE16586.1 T9SS C-terminal target domain-containing protein [Putridiphycobacter roseus]
MKLFYLGCLLLMTTLVHGQVYHAGTNNDLNFESRAAGCSPPNSSTFLELNNVKALIHTAGNLWQVAGQNNSHYEVPKGSGIMALFTSSLWLGGLDANGQLKLAALRYRNGQDYWTGPLVTNGEAEVTPETCIKYDKHFSVLREEVAQFASWFQAGIEDKANGTNFQSTNFPDYKIPKSILEWPAHGDVTLNQPYYLAPFYDNPNSPNGLNGFYDPEVDGDYPWYDINKDVDCRNSRTVTLFGDQTLWWIMNDKGNIHTETGGEPLGMEIRAQAFAFATNNEIDNMTFYNYELINRSTQTLYDTYFGVLVDVALGGPNDDYVGCDVSRGLGYAYNGDNYDGDEQGYKGYGNNPPAVGVDFFEGPYQDNDNLDNPLTDNIDEAILNKGIPYEGLGIGYGDGLIDNERFGMRRFIYYNNSGSAGNSAQTDPQNAVDYYAYLKGYWKDGSRFVYGGSGHVSDPEANPNVHADFMFPGNTDPLGWGTEGTVQAEWTEESSNNIPYDRRFAQSAGPFILKPGAVNNITMGVVWARATSGGPFESVKKLFVADDKAQALFDNCFNILEGPHAPDLKIQEMENQLIITISNPTGSNNENELYQEIDPEIINVDNVSDFDNEYRFQGYQIYQLKSKDIAANNLDDLTKARLVFQCDIEDNYKNLINYTFDLDMNAAIPTVEVKAENKGIKHSLLVTEDLFATGDRTLVNFKKYYYMAIAYAVNDYKTFIPDDPQTIDGQKQPYIASRKAAFGSIQPVLGIPHNPSIEGNGTSFGTYYGWSPKVTQIEGVGNGNRVLELSDQSLKTILTDNKIDEVEYKAGFGPIDVKVIDPLNLKAGNYTLTFSKDADISRGGVKNDTKWVLNREYEGVNETYASLNGVGDNNEEIIAEWGLSVTLNQYEYGGEYSSHKWTTAPISNSINFSDSSKIWLSGIPDSDINFTTNWIRAGSNFKPNPVDPTCSPALWVNNPCYYYDSNSNNDPSQHWEGILNGIITSFKYVGYEVYGMPMGNPGDDPNTAALEGYYQLEQSTFNSFRMANMHDIDIQITKDQSLWTKCVVIEMNDNENQTVGGADVLELREQLSVNKDGIPVSDGDKSMGWFPGYAININTGKRLNMAFGENSWLAGENGNDMIWNPSTNITNTTGEPLMGGMHYVYVFDAVDDMPEYDQGQYIKTNLSKKTEEGHKAVFEYCTWIAAPLANEFHTILESDVAIKIRLSKPYTYREETKASNKGMPKYKFTITENERVQTDVLDELADKLNLINIVPNPYYAYSLYEETRLDKVVKITNLPKVCKIRIFTVSGQFIREFNKASDITSIDWDLTNTAGIPIASGVYIIHIEVPGVGEKVLKWFGTSRKPDFDNL